jgi:hypothetical protein
MRHRASRIRCVRRVLPSVLGRMMLPPTAGRDTVHRVVMVAAADARRRRTSWHLALFGRGSQGGTRRRVLVVQGHG